jgi:hypothetical protein
MRWILALVVALIAPAPAPPDGDSFEFFHPSVTVTADQRELLLRGIPIVSLPDAKSRELVVFSAIALDPQVTDRRAAAWFRDVAALRKSGYLLQMGRFSPTPRIDDLAALTLDDDDLEDIHDCRPERCGVKLSAAEIAMFREVIRSAGKNWKPVVEAAFRRMVLTRIHTYAEKGHLGIGAYCDNPRRRSPAEAFSGLVASSTFLHQRAPEVVESLLSGCRVAKGDPGEFLYWSKERLNGKAVIGATHVRLFHGDGRTAPEVLMVGKQIFATHYFDASLGVTILARDRATSVPCLLYLNRSEVDLLGGFWGGFARRLIEGRIRGDGPAVIREIGRRISAGDPPGDDSLVPTPPVR